MAGESRQRCRVAGGRSQQLPERDLSTTSPACGTPAWRDSRFLCRTGALDDLAEFVEGRTDNTLLADLLWGLSLIDWSAAVRSPSACGASSRPAKFDSGEHGSCLLSARIRQTSRSDPASVVPSSFYALSPALLSAVRGSELRLRGSIRKFTRSRRSGAAPTLPDSPRGRCSVPAKPPPLPKPR